jgi:hypothetical protein
VSRSSRGEPGIGKTSLVTRFLGDLDAHIRVLIGTCDDLAIPRPLGTIRDLAGRVSSDLTHALSTGAAPHEIQALLLAELARPASPTILVIEDIHWADDATLDVVTVVGRRIGSLPRSSSSRSAAARRCRPIPTWPWTIEELGREVGLSRSALHERRALRRSAAHAVPRVLLHAAGGESVAWWACDRGKHRRGGRIRVRGRVRPGLQASDGIAAGVVAQDASPAESALTTRRPPLMWAHR